MKEVMGHVLDPAADAIWSAAGYDVTEAGERDLSPTTDEGWLAVENGAATVAETANLLMVPARVPDDGDDWIRYSQQLHAAGLKALAAADARDKQAVFDTGGEIYQVCVACHRRYWTGAAPGRADAPGGG
jgi:mono/diheme cytochrome c family protein